MKKVAAYMRVGNKEQLELTEQQQKEAMEKVAQEMHYTMMPPKNPIPTPEELESEGYEVVTLPDGDQDEDEAPTMSMGGGMQ